MARIFKNKTVEEVSITCDNLTQIIPGGGQFDLATVFTAAQLQACDHLVGLLGQGVDKYALDDGSGELPVATAIDLVRCIHPTMMKVTTDRTAGDGSPLFSSRKPDSPKLTFITPNWCDKTTWYSSSTYVASEVAGDSGDHTTYELDHQNVIDTYHGLITFEDYLKDSEGRSFRVVVKVNDVAKTEQDPHLGTGGDYTVDYAAGKIAFLAALQPADAVTVEYHYAVSSTYVIAPSAGKILIIDKVEVQFSEDIEMKDTFLFQAYGLVDVFAPQLMQPPYNLPSGTKIPLGDPLSYKTLSDLLNDSNHAYPSYPAIGNGNWRAMKKPAYIFAWDYDVGATNLHSSAGMEIRVSLQHEAVCGGAFATATFYCTSEDEA